MIENEPYVVKYIKKYFSMKLFFLLKIIPYNYAYRIIYLLFFINIIIIVIIIINTFLLFFK